MGRYNNFLQKGVYCKHLISSSVDVDILGQIELLNIKSNIDSIEKKVLFLGKNVSKFDSFSAWLKTLTNTSYSIESHGDHCEVCKKNPPLRY